MNSKAIVGVSLAAVFAFAMMSNPVLAIHPSLSIAGTSFTANDNCTITAGGKLETATKGHDVIVYVCLSQAPGTDGQTAWLAAVHPSFNDDSDQAPGNKRIHGHTVTLDVNNCVTSITTEPTITVVGNTITIPITGSVDTFAIIGYDASDAGLCPTTIYDIV